MSTGNYGRINGFSDECLERSPARVALSAPGRKKCAAKARNGLPVAKEEQERPSLPGSDGGYSENSGDLFADSLTRAP